MKHKKFRQEVDSRWIQPVAKNYYMACCDCCLVHRLDFRIVNGRVQFRASRAPKYTARLRKEKRIVLKGE